MKIKTVRFFQVLIMAIPTLAYLWASATILNVKPSVIIRLKENNIHHEYVMEDKIFLYTMNSTATYDLGRVEYNSEVRSYGVYVKLNTTVKIDKKYYGVGLKDDKTTLELQEFSAWKVQKKESTNLPIATIITMFALIIIIFIYKRGLGWAKKYPKLSIWISLAVGTGVLFGINQVVSNMFWVFLIVLASWTGVCITENVFLDFKKDIELEKKKREV